MISRLKTRQDDYSEPAQGLLHSPKPGISFAAHETPLRLYGQVSVANQVLMLLSTYISADKFQAVKNSFIGCTRRV